MTKDFYAHCFDRKNTMMNTERIPNDYDLPNKETIAAMKEVNEMRKHPEQYSSFTSVDGMLDKLLKSNDSDEVHSAG